MNVAVLQLLYAGIAGILLGDTYPHMAGIFFALMCLSPIIYLEDKK